MRGKRNGYFSFWLMAACMPLGGCAAAAPSCTPIPGDLNGNGANEEYLIGLILAVLLYGLWRFLRRK